jgi:hypothetical protein
MKSFHMKSTVTREPPRRQTRFRNCNLPAMTQIIFFHMFMRIKATTFRFLTVYATKFCQIILLSCSSVWSPALSLWGVPIKKNDIRVNLHGSYAETTYCTQIQNGTSWCSNSDLQSVRATAPLYIILSLLISPLVNPDEDVPRVGFIFGPLDWILLQILHYL